MKRFVLICSIVLGVHAGSVWAAPIQADIVFVLDNSYSMMRKLPLIKSRLAQFNAAMVANNIDAEYALVKFGHVERLLTDLGPFTGLASPLATLHGKSNNPERGSAAVELAMSSITFRPGAVKNIILITDEDDDSPLSAFTGADSILGSTDAFFNFIGVPGVNNTDSRYGVLAANHHGTAFDIHDFVAHPDDFFSEFIDVKLSEITAPEPATLVLLSVGGLVALRRRHLS